jgi:hypothetical protein
MSSLGSRIWAILGLGFISVLLGFLVGASNSPVAGVTLTALAGLLGPIVAIATLRQRERSSARRNLVPEGDHNETGTNALSRLEEEDFWRVGAALGKAAVIFSVMFLAGVLLGATVRYSGFPRVRTTREFPWNVADSAEAPRTPEEALLWLGLQRSLEDRDYTPEQIQFLYKLALKNRALQIPQSAQPNKTTPNVLVDTSLNRSRPIIDSLWYRRYFPDPAPNEGSPVAEGGDERKFPCLPGWECTIS